MLQSANQQFSELFQLLATLISLTGRPGALTGLGNGTIYEISMHLMCLHTIRVLFRRVIGREIQLLANTGQQDRGNSKPESLYTAWKLEINSKRLEFFAVTVNKGVGDNLLNGGSDPGRSPFKLTSAVPVIR